MSALSRRGILIDQCEELVFRTIRQVPAVEMGVSRALQSEVSDDEKTKKVRREMSFAARAQESQLGSHSAVYLEHLNATCGLASPTRIASVGTSNLIKNICPSNHIAAHTACMATLTAISDTSG